MDPDEEELVLVKRSDLTALVEAVQQGFADIHAQLDKLSAVPTVPVIRHLPKDIVRRALRAELTRPPAKSA